MRGFAFSSVLLGIAVAACAQAVTHSGPDDVGGDGDGGGGTGDGTGNGNGEVPVDGPTEPVEPPVDGPPAPRAAVLSQSTSMDIVDNNSSVCLHNPDKQTRVNNYYRVFSLADANISSAFHVTKVTFAVEFADAGGPTQPVDVKLHTLSGAVGNTGFDRDQLTQVAATTVALEDAERKLIDVPLVADFVAGSTVVLEVSVPDGEANNNVFFIGSNPGGESKPTYWRAPRCGTNEPEPLSESGQDTMHVVMNVSGTH